MGKTISFTTDEASGVAKGTKRLRGDGRQKTEIKKYNPFNVAYPERSINIYNTNYSTLNDAFPVFSPIPLYYPTVGDASIQRIGNKIYMKYIRFKGYFELLNRMVCPVRWRLCLMRVDFNTDVQVTITQNWYLGHFLFCDTTVQNSTVGVDAALSWSRHNFYKKVKDVNDKTFKRKVIASGFFPAVNNHMNYEGQFVGTMGDAPMSGTFDFNGFNASHHGGFVGYVPVDVTVKLYDNVDCNRNLRRYYLIFETDNCIGYDADLTPMTGSLAGSVVRLSLHALTYFTDS